MKTPIEKTTPPEWIAILASMFDTIKNEQLGDIGLFKRQLSGHLACSVSAGLRLPESVPCIIYRLPLDSLRRHDFRIITKGFIAETSLPSVDNNAFDLEVRLADETFREHFELMATDLLSSTAAAGSSSLAAELLFERLRMWRDFSAKLDAGGLGLDQLVGLAAELTIFRHLFDIGVPSAVVTQSWVGPVGHQHDFRLPAGSIEVKSCRTIESTKVTFSSTKQLEAIEGLPLFLGVVRININEPNGNCLPDLVNDLRDLLRKGGHTTELGKFSAKLGETGYYEGSEDDYSRIRLLIEPPLFYKVDSDFPKIASEAVPAEVDRLNFRMLIPSSVPEVEPDWSSLCSDQL